MHAKCKGLFGLCKSNQLHARPTCCVSGEWDVLAEITEACSGDVLAAPTLGLEALHAGEPWSTTSLCGNTLRRMGVVTDT